MKQLNDAFPVRDNVERLRLGEEDFTAGFYLFGNDISLSVSLPLLNRAQTVPSATERTPPFT